MNKVKSSAGKKCAASSDSQTIKNELNLEGKIEKLSIKPKSVNGLLNGVDRKPETRPNKKDKRVRKEDRVADRNDSDAADDANEGDAKGKARPRRTDSERPVASTSAKGDWRYRPDEPDAAAPSDFDVMAYIRGRYGDRKEDERDAPTDAIADGPPAGSDPDGTAPPPPHVENPEIEYVQYDSELQMPMIMKIIQKDLSEPYSIYTYRYFIHNWPNLCFLAMYGGECVGAIVCKLDVHRKLTKRGYIAMLAVDKRFRKHGIGSTLVRRAIEEMVAGGADEVVLETEITNRPALRLYEALGFVRDKRLFRYYLNGVDALRLKLWLR